VDEWSRQLSYFFLAYVDMPKNCCVVGCNNVFEKGKISFYRFPSASRYPVKRSKWIAAVKCENRVPKASSWICCRYFVTGKKSNDPLAPNYIPSIFPQLKSPAKCKLEESAAVFQRREATKRKRLCYATSDSEETSDLEATSKGTRYVQSRGG